MDYHNKYYNQGYDAFNSGKSIIDNPYEFGIPIHKDWHFGYTSAYFDLFVSEEIEYDECL